MVHVHLADEAPVLLRDQAQREEAFAVEGVVLVAHLFHRRRVIRVRPVAASDERLVIGGPELTHAVHGVASARASASWFSTARRSLTVPKS
jgi:hypothetical protein